MLSQSIQDYLKTIYKFEEIEGYVSTTTIAKELKISGASVTGMLKRLFTMGFVDYNSYKGARLSETGKKIALEILRHHRLLETYLKEHLGYSLEKVHDEACRLEHHISEDFIDKIDEILGNPEFDPHGHPIPDKEGEIHISYEKPLTDFQPGQTIIIRRLSDNDPKMLEYFEKLGLIPGVILQIIEIAPFKGPLSLNWNGSSNILGNEVAKNIFVEAYSVE